MDGLRQMGQPWEDKAVAHFEAAVAKGSELGFYSAYTQRSLEKLQQYRPDKYPREDLGFELSVVADVAARSPILLAPWDEVSKNPDLLNEPPLRTERQPGEPVVAPPSPQGGPGKPSGAEPDKTPPPAKGAEDGAGLGEDEEKEPGEAAPEKDKDKDKKPEPPSDPASTGGDEPSDDF
jgi:hypothetical protein